ncbi:hypothetical protein COU80_01585 [Candidatus Peregrinibacteria bacterium CG10_big_fil_rev_8_21_14_0_10_55_24]|nr:MAG: hypothetical protein COU80_01585 [Candidatus Peregrinibacteria bacterium CG10_big_fil_rev_8_21_14_0_10_55_24]
MEQQSSSSPDEVETSAPFWTKVGAPRPGAPDGDRVAVLDVYEPTYVPAQLRCTEEEVEELRARGLTSDGEYALRRTFGAGSITDMQEVARSAITEGGFVGIQTLPNTDSGPRQTSACPYLSGMFGKDPKDVDLLGVAALREFPSVFIELVNARGKQMRRDEKRMCEHHQYHHAHLRAFKLAALRIAYDRMMEDGMNAEFETFWEKHARDSDRLLDCAVTMVLEERFQASWFEWPEEIACKKPIELLQEDASLAEDARYLLYVQWVLQEQWSDCSTAVRAVGGHMIEDRAYSVSRRTPEVWRDWREQHMEGKQGVFHIGPDRQPTYSTGVNVAGDPYGPQKWGHVVPRFIENPDGVIDYIVETIAQDEGRIDIRRVDHALAWIWKYYRVPWEKNASEGEYFHALKEKIFNRLRERFPDVYWIIEDVGYTDGDVLRTQQWLGLGPFKSFKWAPGHNGSLDPLYRSPKEAPPSAVVLDDNADLRAFEVWFLQLSRENRRHYIGEIYGQEHTDERFHRHVVQGERHDTEAVLRWLMRSRAHIAVTTLQSAGNSVVADDRDENSPGLEHPQFWQLLSRLERGDLPEVFAMTRHVIEETRRETREILSPGSLQVLALSMRPGQGQYVKQGGTFILRIACNRPPQADTRIECNAQEGNRDGVHLIRPQEGGLSEPCITSCARYQDGTYVWEIAGTVAQDAQSWAVIELSPCIVEGEERHALCLPEDRLYIQVQPEGT